ncbi:MAG: hypothetical protein KZQ65_07335, partial [Candidatus Thiodiazotropha sp. (ex Gloverina cf. vestifex)]|nr:hypothetical protein [Candidatus Thiodiazotropha sp. (ex Gloverina cf. vestifex)]
RGITAVALASRFWGLGCPKIFHEVATRLIEWEGQALLEILPARIPDLYLGEPLLVVVKSESLDGEVLIQGDRDGTVWRHRVDWPSKTTQEGLHKLWARQQIKALMSSTVDGESVEVRRQQVLQLALRHQLVSAYTSLIAVERQPVRPLSAPLKGGPIPLNLPVGWDAIMSLVLCRRRRPMGHCHC